MKRGNGRDVSVASIVRYLSAINYKNGTAGAEEADRISIPRAHLIRSLRRPPSWLAPRKTTSSSIILQHLFLPSKSVPSISHRTAVASSVPMPRFEASPALAYAGGVSPFPLMPSPLGRRAGTRVNQFSPTRLPSTWGGETGACRSHVALTRRLVTPAVVA